MSKPFLSFTIERESRTIQLCANDAGIDKLIDALHDLKLTGHLHLWDTTNFPTNGILSEKDPWGQPAICDVSMTTGPYDE
jgi:hypothetical protein